MRSLRFVLLALVLAAAGLAWLNRGVCVVELPRLPIAAAAIAAAAMLTWRCSGARRGLGVGVAFVGLTLAGAAGLEQAVVWLNRRLDAAPPMTLTAVVDDVVPQRGWLGGDGDACDVVLQPWRPGRAPLRVGLDGSTLLRDQTSGEAVICRTAEASPIRRGERVAVRVHRGALGLEYLAADGGQGVLTPPCSTCGKGD